VIEGRYSGVLRQFKAT